MKKKRWIYAAVLVLVFLLLTKVVPRIIYPLPKEKVKPISIDYKEYTKDSLQVFEIGNPLHCPIRIWLTDKNESKEETFFLLEPFSDTIIYRLMTGGDIPKVSLAVKLGKMNIHDATYEFSLPFPKNRSCKIIQGTQSQPTHNTNASRYAIDFGMAIGDTICAAADGFVIGVVEAYKDGGGKRWKPYSNFIMLYHPQNGIFTQYGHLVQNGSLVEVGDSIKRGQNIGLAGMTGQTNIEHLHFNALLPDESKKGMNSVPIYFGNNVKTTDMKRGQRYKL